METTIELGTTAGKEAQAALYCVRSWCSLCWVWNSLLKQPARHRCVLLAVDNLPVCLLDGLLCWTAPVFC
jgi:hypothetical protein